MWSSLLSSTEGARASLTSALERAGDGLTERATAHVARQRAAEAQRQQASAGGVAGDSSSAAAGSSGSAPVGTAPTIAVIPDEPRGSAADGDGSRNDALPADGNAPASHPTHSQPLAKIREGIASFDKQKQSEMLGRLQMGWGSVVEASTRAIEATREAVEKEQTRLQAAGFLKGGPYKRDPSLPLDVEALRDAEVVYVTDRLITMSHPAMQSTTDGDITPDRKLAAVGQLLDRRHGGRYMVWNLSEVEYDYGVLNDQVLTYRFPGSPSPPLGLLLKLLLSVESWLKADRRNVAVMHCLTGRGRTSTVLAAFLCWTGEAGFHDPMGALEYVAHCKRTNVENLTIPSQRRYASYFANMLDGVRPSQPPLLLKRIIMSEAPKFGKRPLAEEEEIDVNDLQHSQLGCAPYLQIFKAGNLVLTTAATCPNSSSQSNDDLPFVMPTDGPISFPIETIVQGDILLRCRHLTRKGQRVSMFRAAFHTGYVPPKVLRLDKSQLDGACSDRRFTEDFFLDLIFEKCDAAMASRHLLPAGTDDDNTGSDGDVIKNNSGKEKKEVVHCEAEARRRGGTISGMGTAQPEALPESKDEPKSHVVTASAYDSMLHRDSRFWDVIAERRRENIGKMAKAAGATAATGGSASTDEEGDNSADLLCGPTIGRRRDFASMPGGGSGGSGEGGESEGESGNIGKDGNDKSDGKGHPPKKSPMDAFSIGGEFDFFLEDDEEEPEPTKAHGPGEGSAAGSHPAAAPPLSPPKRDELMDALMALDDDDLMSPSPKPFAKKALSLETDATKALSLETEEVMFTDDRAKGADHANGPAGKGSAPGVLHDAAPSLPFETSETKSQQSPIDGLGGNEAASAGPTTPTAAIGSTLDDGAAVRKSPANVAGSEAAKEASIPTIEGLNLDVDTVEDDELQDVSAPGRGSDDANFDDYDFDDDDEELEDLENFLTKASGK